MLNIHVFLASNRPDRLYCGKLEKNSGDLCHGPNVPSGKILRVHDVMSKFHDPKPKYSEVTIFTADTRTNTASHTDMQEYTAVKMNCNYKNIKATMKITEIWQGINL